MTVNSTLDQASNSSANSSSDIARRSYTTTVINRRNVAPAHFLYKIDSFSELVRTKVEKYETGFFQAGGYKWKLILYPDGDKKNGGQDHISLYVGIEETNGLPNGWEVRVDLKLFVYDQNQNEYMVIRDELKGGIKRFRWTKTEIGFGQLILKKDFLDESNGYLKKDSCVFGAEIFVITPTAKTGSLSMIKNPQNATLTWTIDDFFKKSGILFSNILTVGGTAWKIKVHPEGNGLAAEEEYLSIYIVAHDPPPGTNVYAEVSLRVVDQRRDNHVEKFVRNWFTPSSSGWGSTKFLPLGDLHQKSKGFVMNGSLIIVAQVLVVSVVN